MLLKMVCFDLAIFEAERHGHVAIFAKCEIMVALLLKPLPSQPQPTNHAQTKNDQLGMILGMMVLYISKFWSND